MDLLKAMVLLLGVLLCRQCKSAELERNGFPVEMVDPAVVTGKDERPNNAQEIGNFSPDDLVHHYTQEVINENRKITYNVKTGEETYEMDAEVVKILETVRKNNATQLFSSYSLPNDTNDEGIEESLPEEKRGPRDVIGSDNRYRITNTSQFPHCAMGQLQTSVGDCSLVMVGPYHALTAAHCVYDRSRWRFHTNRSAYIGRSCDNEGTRVGVAHVTVYRAYVDTGDTRYDFAWLVLNSSNINTGCYMGFAYRDPMLTVSMTMCGYPADKDPDPYSCLYCTHCSDARRYCSGTWWSRTCTNEQIQYSCDSAGGMSGGPAYTSAHVSTSTLQLPGLSTHSSSSDSTSTLYIYGIHTHSSSSGNLASRISKQKFTDVCKWLRATGGSCSASV